MIIRATAERPVKLALAFRDRAVVDRGDPASHQAGVIELPILIAVGPKPATVVVAPFVREPYCDPVSLVRPDFFDEAIVQLEQPPPGGPGCLLVHYHLRRHCWS